MARYYEQGIGCKKNFAEALRVMQDLKQDCDCADTLCQLASLYHHDVLPAKEARLLLQKAVAKDETHQESWLELGILYLNGNGGKPK